MFRSSVTKSDCILHLEQFLLLLKKFCPAQAKLGLEKCVLFYTSTKISLQISDTRYIMLVSVLITRCKQDAVQIVLVLEVIIYNSIMRKAAYAFITNSSLTNIRFFRATLICSLLKYRSKSLKNSIFGKRKYYSCKIVEGQVANAFQSFITDTKLLIRSFEVKYY